jgi:hypothetical protein
MLNLPQFLHGMSKNGEEKFSGVNLFRRFQYNNRISTVLAFRKQDDVRTGIFEHGIRNKLFTLIERLYCVTINWSPTFGKIVRFKSKRQTIR